MQLFKDHSYAAFCKSLGSSEEFRHGPEDTISTDIVPHIDESNPPSWEPVDFLDIIDFSTTLPIGNNNDDLFITNYEEEQDDINYDETIQL